MTPGTVSRRCVCAALAAAAFGAAALGHAQPSGAAAGPPRYRVEIIVFANRNFNPGEELFEPAAPSLEAARLQRSDDLFLRSPAFEQLLQNPTQLGGPSGQTPSGPPANVGPPSAGVGNAALPGDANASLPGEIASAPVEPPFRLLAPEELTLGNVSRRLESDGRWQPVLHSGWVQNVVGEAQTEPVRFTRLGVHNPMGAISFYSGRNFLHLRLDVTYSEPDGTTFAGAAANFDGQPGGGRSLEPIVLPPRYRLEQSRQTRSGALQYFDHPAFGVLVQVTEIPPALPATGGARGRPAP